MNSVMHLNSENFVNVPVFSCSIYKPSMKGSLMSQFKFLLSGVGLLATLASADLPTDTISGHIIANKLLDSAHAWIIKGRTKVDSGFTLTIEPGTTIKGQYSSQGTLAIGTGAKIIAAGTKEHPITFTSTEAKRGGWGGIVLLGRAPTNEAKKAAGFEAVPEWSYGGDNIHDSSGVMTYVIINWPGFAVEVDKELNGITFCGVGDKTVINHIQSNNGDDDAFEWFGGTVNVDHLVATNESDDGFDMDNGYSGTANSMIVVQGHDANQTRHYYFYGENGDTLKYLNGPKVGQYHDTTYSEIVGDNGIEASSNPVAGKLPQLNPKWSNLTIIDNGIGKGPFQEKENGSGHFDRMLLVADSSAWVVSMLDAGTANNFIMPNPLLTLTRTYYTGTFKKKWDIKDTTAVGKGAAILLDSTVKFVEDGLYKDLGVASSKLVDDSVGAIIGQDSAHYWYKGWTIPGTVFYAKGKDRTAVGINARSVINLSGISSIAFASNSILIQSLSALTAKIEILDLAGRSVLDLGKVEVRAGRNVIAKDAMKDMLNGLYFLKVSAQGKTYSAKILLEDKR